MEKEIKVNEVKEMEIKEDFRYKKVSEMTKEEFKQLDSVSVQIVANMSRTGSKYYTATIRFNKEFNKRINLDETQYLLLKYQYKFDSTILINAKIRFFKGIRDDGSEWYSYQVILSRDVILSAFFSRSEIALLKIYMRETAKYQEDKNCKLTMAEAVNIKTNESYPIFNYNWIVHAGKINEELTAEELFGE